MNLSTLQHTPSSIQAKIMQNRGLANTAQIQLGKIVDRFKKDQAGCASTDAPKMWSAEQVGHYLVAAANAIQMARQMVIALNNDLNQRYQEMAPIVGIEVAQRTNDTKFFSPDISKASPEGAQEMADKAAVTAHPSAQPEHQTQPTYDLTFSI